MKEGTTLGPVWIPKDSLLVGFRTANSSEILFLNVFYLFWLMFSLITCVAVLQGVLLKIPLKYNTLSPCMCLSTADPGYCMCCFSLDSDLGVCRSDWRSGCWKFDSVAWAFYLPLKEAGTSSCVRYDTAPRGGMYFSRLVAGGQLEILNGSRLRGESWHLGVCFRFRDIILGAYL